MNITATATATMGPRLLERAVTSRPRADELTSSTVILRLNTFCRSSVIPETKAAAVTI